MHLLRKESVRANQTPFITKTSSKEIMQRSRLRNKFLNTKSDIDKKVYLTNCVTMLLVS